MHGATPGRGETLRWRRNVFAAAGVFLLDVFAFLALAAVVSRLMVTAPLAKPAMRMPEEV